jgi:hypothetical protein
MVERDDRTLDDWSVLWSTSTVWSWAVTSLSVFGRLQTVSFEVELLS